MAPAPDIAAHFRSVDPVLFQHLHLIEGRRLSVSKSPFADLVEAVTNQQLSEKAGSTIFRRLKALFPSGRMTPDGMLSCTDQQLRDVGISWSKVSYIKAIAAAAKEQTVDFDTLPQQSDEDVIRQLTKIRGVGVWTAEMFLMFTLGRPDVFSFGDLGLKRAIQELYGLNKEPSRRTMQRLSDRWKPYRTYAALVLWKFKDR